MINPKLHLQAPKEAMDGDIKGDFPILLLFSVNSKRIQYYTGISMPVQYHVNFGITDLSRRKKGLKYPWNNKWQQAPAAKTKLDALIRHAYSIETDFINSGVDQSVDLYRAELDKRFKGRGANVIKKQSIGDRISEYLQYVQDNLTHNSFRNNQTNLNHLRDFMGDRLNTTDLNLIDEDFISEYSKHLRDGRLNNTVVKALQILGRFMNYCRDRKYISEAPRVKTGRPNDITVIHLTYDEVIKIAYTPMPSLALERVRDFFLLGCNTGMRYGDLAALKKDNCHEKQIEFFNQKNGETQTIKVPYTDMSKLILSKYKNDGSIYAIPSISNQKTNDALKEVAEIAGIDSKIEIAHKLGNGKIVKETVTKNKLISCHTSRKSYITIAMTLGMKESTIKSITGHEKGSKAFHKYYDVTDTTKDEEMKKFNR
ncbi:tyrosine-type recombinase/integrase [Pedobacter cryotolerans]|uniref:Core-binding (CB) domain-containing protein n=1 Tax=Pedobacter cryotolerans TaxID=2571270 RepID=A0A4U1C7A4_9SPHI|nr:phage integrase SAM-like domain-containing protein [Pedobacter cryotolerans]TKC01247.1 hypothetical protein FA045_08355 [Pedobacter cryotolerans]